MAKGVLSERELIRNISDRISFAPADLQKGIGDDCAVVRKNTGVFSLFTIDTLVESVHFDLAWHPPELLGRKALSVNVSDIAAMGGVPRFVLLSLAVPEKCDKQSLEHFINGFTAALDEYQVSLAGGDTVRSLEGLMVSVTVCGEVSEKNIVYRSGAEPGDMVWVSGPLGDAAAGLNLCRRGTSTQDPKWRKLIMAHLDPKAQVNLGPLLGESGLVHAMMDISDGLATDLAHICSESGTGAEINAGKIPLSERMQEAAAFLSGSPLEYALKGGEDYELLFTCPPENGKALQSLVREKTGRDIFHVGRITRTKGVLLVQEGKKVDVGFQGYDHFSQ